MPDWSIKNIPQRDSSIKYTTKNQDPNRYVIINNIDYIELTVREAIVHSSLGLSQGYVRCNCGGKCANNRCTCRAAQVHCNTKCHPKTSTLCTNTSKEPANAADVGSEEEVND